MYLNIFSRSSFTFCARFTICYCFYRIHPSCADLQELLDSQKLIGRLSSLINNFLVKFVDNHKSCCSLFLLRTRIMFEPFSSDFKTIFFLRFLLLVGLCTKTRPWSNSLIPTILVAPCFRFSRAFFQVISKRF